MATYVPTEGIFTTYEGMNYSEDSHSVAPLRITSITDNDGNNQQFTANETLTMSLSNGHSISVKYLGTTTAIDGGPYIVLQNSNDSTAVYVVGTGRTATAGNTVSGEKVAPGTYSGLNVDNSAFTVCFFPGTMIATPSGERRVEDLVSGDSVLVEDVGSVPATWTGRIARNLRRRLGLRRSVPVKWLGRQTVSTLFGPAERLMPVRFAAGSLGGGGNPFCRIAN